MREHDDEAEDPGDLYAHPYLIGEIDPAVAERLGWDDAAAVLRDVVIADEMLEAEDGTFTKRSVVRFPERWRDPDVGPATEVPRPSEAVVHPELERWLASDEPSREFWVTIQLGESFAPLPMRLHHAVLEGRVLTRADAERTRAELVQERRDAAIAEIEEFAEAVAAGGGRVVDAVPAAGLVRLHATPEAARYLLELELVQGMEPVPALDEADDAGIAWPVVGLDVDGYEVSDLIQSHQFYDEGYYGRTQETITLSETLGDTVRRGHLGFDNASGVDRFENCTGTSTSCVSNPNSNPGTDHGTSVASILLGDITRSQDPAFSVSCALGSTACEQRSGVARRSKGIGVDSNEWPHVDWAATTKSLVLTQSASSATQDPTCGGNSARARAWNAMFEEGVALFNSDGNDGHASTTDCTVGAPASSLGVFAVSPYDTDPSATPADSPTIFQFSSRGGTSTEGVRTIIGLAGPHMVLNTYEESSAASPQYDGQPFVGSSAATPAVAGAAVLYRQWYLAENSSLIDDPGVLYAEMLLMGDRRHNDTGGTLTESYSNLWGAGVLRLRKYDAAGMDAWALHQVGSTCVGHGETVVALQTAAPVHANVDYVKAVAWTYDSKHDDQEGFDRIKLSVDRQLTALPLPTWATIVDDDDDNDKLRVFADDVGEWVLRLRLNGLNVNQDDAGCGTDAARVHFAWLIEDNARNDDSYLTTHVRPEL